MDDTGARTTGTSGHRALARAAVSLLTEARHRGLSGADRVAPLVNGAGEADEWLRLVAGRLGKGREAVTVADVSDLAFAGFGGRTAGSSGAGGGAAPSKSMAEAWRDYRRDMDRALSGA